MVFYVKTTTIKRIHVINNIILFAHHIVFVEMPSKLRVGPNSLVIACCSVVS